jgi:cytoskeletal protein CcmA (bactofilin family)
MFKNEKEHHGQEMETVIAPSVRVEGDFDSEGNIRVEGAVSGSISTKQDLFVGEGAEVTADVTARNAVISGVMRGNLAVEERLDLTETARVYGDTRARVLSVAPGATLDGNLSIGGEKRDEKAAAPPKAKNVREKKIEEILQQQEA